IPRSTTIFSERRAMLIILRCGGPGRKRTHARERRTAGGQLAVLVPPWCDGEPDLRSGSRDGYSSGRSQSFILDKFANRERYAQHVAPASATTMSANRSRDSGLVIPVGSARFAPCRADCRLLPRWDR